MKVLQWDKVSINIYSLANMKSYIFNIKLTYFLVINHTACNKPGIKNSKHKIILINKSFPTPDFKNTATGGNNIARIISTN
jgi:hypothetical protein